MARPQSQAILFELLRSFTTLAETLNLSKAVRMLGSTRQTVRRHIDLLEKSKGEALFTLEDRQYHLTEAGQRSLPEAQNLLARGKAWLDNQSDHINGLFRLAIDPTADSEFYYYLQQQPLSRLWSDSSPMMQYGFQAWAEARGKIEHPALSSIRPYLMVFRQLEDAWVCVEVGEKSSYATWHGWEWQRSSVGRGVADLPGGTAIANLLVHPFKDVLTHETVRLDHIHTQNKVKNNEQPEPISYQRMLMGCRFPDDSFALASLIDRTHNIEIEGLNPERILSMSKKYVMNVKINGLKPTK